MWCTYFLLSLRFCCVLAADEDGICILDDGNFYYEVEGIPEVDPEEEMFPLAKKASKVKFSTSPMKVCTLKVFRFNNGYNDSNNKYVEDICNTYSVA